MFRYAGLDSHINQPFTQGSSKAGGIVAKVLLAAMTEDNTHQGASQHVNLVQRKMSERKYGDKTAAHTPEPAFEVMPHIQLHRPYANQFETSNDKLVDDWVDCEVYIDLCT